MKVTGIVAEYNPFHLGHAYHIRKAREVTEADSIVVVLGGDFTQRGTPAMLDKYTRAKMALSCGADLVLELPVRYACASAEAFASGAVSVLNALGCVDFLSFGSEGGDTGLLQETAALLDGAAQDTIYQSALQDALKSGQPFPAARAKALQAADRMQDAGRPEEKGQSVSPLRLPDQPNDILGIEYCRALSRSHSQIRPTTVKRKGAGYHDSSLHSGFASASALRKQLLNGALPRQLSDAFPTQALEIWDTFLSRSGILEEADFSAMLHYRLLLLAQDDFMTQGSNPSPLRGYADMTPDLADRMINCLDAFTDWNGFCLNLKSRNYTYTRISRCLAHILLDIRQEDMIHSRIQGFPAYLRMLGFSEKAAPLLSAIKRKAALPLLSSLSGAGKKLPPALLPLLSEEIRASHIYQAAVSQKYGKPFVNEYRRQIITPASF